MKCLAGLALLIIIGLTATAEASAASGQINPSFTSEGFNVSGVDQAKYLSDGDVMVSGMFGIYGSNSNVNGLARINPDGTPDTSFATEGSGFGVGKIVKDFYPRSDGKFWAVGSFSDFNGAADSSHAVLLNSDGTRDVSFATDLVGDGSGFQLDIWTVEEMVDGDILIGGTFSSYGGEANSDGLLRLNPDGTVDSAWASLIGFGNSGVADGGVNSSVATIDRCPNGKFIVGGGFTQFNGDSAYNKVLRLNADGSLDTSFQAVGTGLNFSVNALKCRQDGKVFVGGNFTGYNGSSQPNLLRLNADGSVDNSFNPAAPNQYVLAIEELPTGKIVIGGLFDQVGGQNRNYIAQLNTDGSLGSSFNMGDGFCANANPPCGFPRVNSLQANSRGSLLVAGEFRSYNGLSSEQVVVLYGSAKVLATVSGPGTVSSSPSGINCPGTCEAWYDQGQAVTLTAGPDNGYIFSGWSDGCSGSGTCLLNANNNIAAATFAEPQPNPNPNPNPDPNPDPSPQAKITISKLKAKLTKKQGRLLSIATVSVAGKINQRATVGKGKKKKTVCKTEKTAAAAGSYQLSCKLSKKTRKQLRTKKLRLMITTTLTPTVGTAVKQIDKLTVKKKR